MRLLQLMKKDCSHTFVQQEYIQIWTVTLTKLYEEANADFNF